LSCLRWNIPVDCRYVLPMDSDGFEQVCIVCPWTKQVKLSIDLEYINIEKEKIERSMEMTWMERTVRRKDASRLDAPTPLSSGSSDAVAHPRRSAGPRSRLTQQLSRRRGGECRRPWRSAARSARGGPKLHS
jgi:hypothetical protein